MSDLLHFFNNNKNNIPPHPERKPKYPEPISREAIENIFDNCSDFQYRLISPGLVSEERIYVCWLDGLVGGGDAGKDILRPLTELFRAGSAPSPERIMAGAVYSSQAVHRTELDDVISDITQACVAVIFERPTRRSALRFAQVRRSAASANRQSKNHSKEERTASLRTSARTRHLSAAGYATLRSR